MAVNPSALGPKPQFVDSNGNPAVGYQIFSYAAGSSTKQNTFTDSTGNTANQNPIVLNALGQPTTEIWFTEGSTYKLVLAPPNDTDPPASPVWTVDNILGINDASITVDQWVVSGFTPTYVSPTSFTLPGDQTTAFQVNRRIKATVTAGTVYGYISVSAYAALTTVTVVLDSGVLDAGLSAVQLGILTPTNSALPAVSTSQIQDSAVTTAKIADANVTNAKLAQAYINDLTTVTFDPNADFVAIADTSDSGNKKKAVIRQLVSGTSVATTSGTSIDFTSLPSWVKRITVNLLGVSTNGTSSPILQIGDSGGIENTGYLGGISNLSGGASPTNDNHSTGFKLIASSTSATITLHGSLVLTLIDAATNSWACTILLGNSAASQAYVGAGTKPLSATLDRVRLTTVGGADTFDAGSINILYE